MSSSASTLSDLWKRTALLLSHQPGILLEIAIRNQTSWLLYMQEFPDSFSNFVEEENCWFSFSNSEDFGSFTKDQISFTRNFGTVIFGHCIQGVIVDVQRESEA